MYAGQRMNNEELNKGQIADSFTGSEEDDWQREFEEEEIGDGAGGGATTGKQPYGRYLAESTFASQKALDEFLRGENCWSYRGNSDSVEGERILYRCNRVKRKSPAQCAASIYTIEKVSTIIMCYFHVQLNVESKYKFQLKTNKTLFKDDIYVLHLCGSEEQFDNACKLFVKKWRAIEPEATRLVQKSFFEEHKNWFMGSHPRSPKHNNGLETFNSSMKRCQTEHRRQPLKQFVNTAMTIVRQRSLEYLKGKEPFQSEVQIDTELLERGCELQLKFAHGAELPNGNTDFYAFRSNSEFNSNGKNAISLGAVTRYQQTKYKTFAEFMAGAFELYKITFPGDDPNKWKEAACTCPFNDANFMCKHIISIAHTLGLIPSVAAVNADADFDDEPLFQHKRGRPKRASKALVIDA